jgi:hypothetical protein
MNEASVRPNRVPAATPRVLVRGLAVHADTAARIINRFSASS